MKNDRKCQVRNETAHSTFMAAVVVVVIVVVAVTTQGAAFYLVVVVHCDNHGVM